MRLTFLAAIQYICQVISPFILSCHVFHRIFNVQDWLVPIVECDVYQLYLYVDQEVNDKSYFNWTCYVPN